MWKGIIGGIAALAIAGGALALAQPRSDRERDGGQRWRPSMEDRRAFGEARLAALKAGLALTPEQERNWPAFEQAARDLGRLRMERMGDMRSAAPADDPVERLRRRATAMADAGAALRRLADAADPLYKSLDDNQKRRFEVLSRFARAGRHHYHGHHDGYRGRDDGYRGRDDDDDDDDEFRGRRDDGYDGSRHHRRRGDMHRMDREPSGGGRL
jgi:hypothetical protein